MNAAISGFIACYNEAVMKKRRSGVYVVILEPDDEGQGFTVRVPALPGCVTEGSTREEALANAREAISGFIEALEKAGEAVPEEKEPVELATVAV